MMSALAEAAIDLKYLLERGYSRERVLDIVTERYCLDRSTRSALYRCIHKSSTSEAIISNFVLKHDRLAVDLLNSLITVLAMIENDRVFICDDCLVRDVRGVKIRSSDKPFIDKALGILVETLSYCNPREVVVVCERQISYSALYAKQFCSLIQYLAGCECRSYIVDKVDTFLIELCSNGYAVCTTDVVVLEQCTYIYPLTYLALVAIGARPTMDFAKLFGINCWKIVFRGARYL